MNPLLPLLHPLLGALAVFVLFLLGLRGLRARRKGADAVRSRQVHRRFTPLALGLVVASWAGGLGSVLLLRSDLSPADSVHFALATGLVALMGFLWWRSPGRTRHEPGAARIHAGVGSAAMGLGLLVAALGLGLLP